MPATPQIMPGADAGLYFNTAVTTPWTTPTWSEQTSVKDATPHYGWDFAEGLSRATPIKLKAKTLIDLPIDVVMRADPDDAIYAAWVALAFSRVNYVDLLLLNSKIATIGACGIRGPYMLSITEEAEPIDGTIYTTFSLQPTLDQGGHVPEWALVGTNAALTFTPITFGT